MRPLLIAHRGDTVHHPENTMRAFQSAFLLGADGIECDVQLVDGNLMIVHDYVFDKTREHLKLDEFLQEFAQHGRIEIEVKSFTLDTISMLAHVLAVHKPQNFELTTSVLFLLPELRKQFPSASLGIIFQPYEFEGWMTKPFVERKVLETMHTLQANVAHLRPEILNTELVASLHQHKFKVHSHILKSNPDTELKLYQRFTEMQVDQCTFDDITLVAQAMK